jgi:hypothetical protein
MRYLSDQAKEGLQRTDCSPVFFTYYGLRRWAIRTAAAVKAKSRPVDQDSSFGRCKALLSLLEADLQYELTQL